MKKYILAALIFVLALLVSFRAQYSDKVVFLDIGQGDSILLQNGNKQVLIDGGPGATVLARLAEEIPWFDRKIEVVIATHPDQDHLEGLLHVVEKYQVELVLLPQMPHSTQLQEEWLKKLQLALEDKKINYRFGWRGQTLKLQDINIELLGPFNKDSKILASGNKTNNAAILTRVDFRGLSFLLTSDAEAIVENMLVDQTDKQKLDVDVLKAGHHGSKTSTTAQLLNATTPKAVVISVGKKNRYGHPAQVTLDRLKDLPVYRTDQLGSVRFMFWRGQWYLGCGHGQLFFAEKSCIKSDITET